MIRNLFNDSIDNQKEIINSLKQSLTYKNSKKNRTKKITKIPTLYFSGKLSDVSGNTLQEVKVVITQDGEPFKETLTGSSGKYTEIEAPFGHKYTLFFKKLGLALRLLIIL